MSHPTDFSRIKLYLYWDVDNCGVDKKRDAYEAVRTIKVRLGICFPNINIASLHAYTNDNKKISEDEIKAIHNNGFIIRRVPARSANAADTSLIIDMFRSDLEQPSLVVLISGDGDFYEAFAC
ncbi:meiosis regulator and mRNA stability factor 1 [Tanacetum coccineum]|uniref:Meiosis regulator and mRNA stability factor 1 n=1 Tax=Tanacetum coccineum TaxID=301880 RepID=A0ABQ5C339_9ASTR